MDNELKCNFEKKENTIYHIYKKENGERYISTVSPKDWNDCVPSFIGEYIGSFINKK